MRVACLTLACLATRTLFGACAHPPLTLEIVFSLCRETHGHRVRDVVSAVKHAAHDSVDVSVVAYCKCGKGHHEACVELPNVGREGHTFIHHIVTRYDRLADVTLFVNGGNLGDEERLAATLRVGALTGAQAATLRYVDLSFQATEADPLLRVSSTESSADFVARGLAARAGCGVTTQGVPCCEGVCEGVPCCHLFTPSDCPNSSMAFEQQHTCYWRGRTDENYAWQTYDIQLLPSDPPSFPLWLSARWGIEFDVWRRVGWYGNSLFAASRAALRRQPLSRWARAMHALGAARNGGMDVHYMERAWRSVLNLATDE